MVSRRKILSRSRDDLNLDAPPEPHDEEDVWYQKEKLFRDHIQEVLNKWESIDDEIWAKIIVVERNRRVAKAYARAPVLTVNGSDDGFDGFRIGLSGFENPMRDPKTEEVKRHIGQGCKIKMDDSGNILIKRISKSSVFIKSTLNSPEETAISNDILKLPNCGLEAEKPVKLFDMKKFQQNVSREMKRGYPDRRKLECQCISAVAFVKNEPEILEAPCWIMLINVVAMDMLKSKMPPDIRNRPRIPIPDEDPYSIAGSGGSSGSSGNGNRERSRDKPPKLPPRDNNAIYGTTGMPRPDYEHMVDEHRFRQQLEARNKAASKKGENKRSEDPYYCGLRARIPNFAKTKAQRDKEANTIYSRLPAHVQPQAHPAYGHLGWPGPARGYLDNVPPPTTNMNNGYSFRTRPFERNPTTWVPKAPMRNDYESDYSHIYGRLPLPTRFRQIPGPPGRQISTKEAAAGSSELGPGRNRRRLLERDPEATRVLESDSTRLRPVISDLPVSRLHWSMVEQSMSGASSSSSSSSSGSSVAWASERWPAAAKYGLLWPEKGRLLKLSLSSELAWSLTLTAAGPTTSKAISSNTDLGTNGTPSRTASLSRLSAARFILGHSLSRRCEYSLTSAPISMSSWRIFSQISHLSRLLTQGLLRAKSTPLCLLICLTKWIF
eukprot:maker-scaffold93_size381549-snap-gene-0.14 protein:Tk04392 transcript:maker-scaffold93_size381549-snap-gene-0.14-mRNA-1 annotation:"AGAP007416-PA"